MAFLSPVEIISILDETYGDRYLYRNKEPNILSKLRYAEFDNPDAHSIDVMISDIAPYPIFQIWISHIHFAWDDEIGTIETGVGPIMISELDGNTPTEKLKRALGLFNPTMSHDERRDYFDENDETDNENDEE